MTAGGRAAGRGVVFGRAITLAALLAAGLIVTSGVIAARELRLAVQAIEKVQGTFETLGQLDRVREALTDAEVGQRGYVLTGKTEYLEPYERGSAAVRPQIERLDTLLAEDGSQRQRLAELRSLADAKLAELARTVELRRKGRLDDALAIVNSDVGKNSMDRIRTLLFEIRHEEEAALHRRISRRDQRHRSAFVATLSLAGLSLAIFGGVLGALHRSTRRRMSAERTALESGRRLSVTLASIGDAVIATDVSGAVVFMNPVAEALTGWSQADARGLPLDRVFRIVNEVTREKVESPVEKALREGVVVGLANHTVLIARDGSERPIDDSGAPIRGAGAEMMGVVLVFRDVTARRQAAQDREDLVRSEAARAAAESTNRAKDEFLAMVSHELRAPLSAAAGWVAVLRDGAIEPEQVARAMGRIERNLRQQARLIDDLLDVSHIVAGRLSVEPAPVEVSGLLRMVVEDDREEAQAKGVSLRLETAGSPAFCFADADRLAQVFVNLLDNAIKFTPPGGAVDVRLTASDGAIEVLVQDTGCGIAPDFLPHLFERFRQAEDVVVRGQAGLGLGLAIAKHLLEIQGGSIHAESEGEGRGARFRVRLPLVDAPVDGAVPGARPVSGTETLAGLRILLVEDHADTREAIAHLLRSRGAEVREAGSTAEALQRLDAERPSVVVSDIGMPGESGFHLIEELRRRDAKLGVHTPAIAMTGFASAQDQQAAIAAGFDAHLPKPVDVAGLQRAICTLLGNDGA
jgi:PAS domain S-box-containing protein